MAGDYGLTRPVSFSSQLMAGTAWCALTRYQRLEASVGSPGRVACLSAVHHRRGPGNAAHGSPGRRARRGSCPWHSPDAEIPVLSAISGELWFFRCRCKGEFGRCVGHRARDLRRSGSGAQPDDRAEDCNDFVFGAAAKQSDVHAFFGEFRIIGNNPAAGDRAHPAIGIAAFASRGSDHPGAGDATDPRIEGHEVHSP